MLLNAFDVDPGAAERILELQDGELFSLGIQADLLVVSSRHGVYDPVPGTLVQGLQQACGIRIAELPRALDLSTSYLAAWVSIPLEEAVPSHHWPERSRTRFQRIAVVENASKGRRETSDEPWPIFHQLFTLLAICHCKELNAELLRPHFLVLVIST